MASSFFRIVRNPVKFNLFLIRKLPAAWFSGLKLVHADEEKAIVTIPYKWFTTNPFRSTYFACLSMAAEMSTGLLAMSGIYGRTPGVSLLIVSMECRFLKKATGITTFSCNDGREIALTIERAISSGESMQFRALSTGVNSAGESVAEFIFTWSFKVKQ